MIKLPFKKKLDKHWTKNTLRNRIIQEINLEIDKNKEVTIKSGIYEIELLFEASNFPNKNKLNLICSIEIKNMVNGKSIFWDDLRSIARMYFKKNKYYLEIGRYEPFENSNLQKECLLAYKPFVQLLKDEEQLEKMIQGEEFTINNKNISLRNISSFLSDKEVRKEQKHMQIMCVANDISCLTPKQINYAFTQDSNGLVDLTIQKIYRVYGIKVQAKETYYLIHTDELNTKSYWWMPASFFKIIDDSKPDEWVKKSIGKINKVHYETYPAYFDWRVAEGIEDGDDLYIEIFEKSFQFNK